MSRKSTKFVASKAFSSAEDHLIRVRFPKGGWSNCKKLMPGRKREEVCHRAKTLGVFNMMHRGPSKNPSSKPSPDKPVRYSIRRCLKCRGEFRSEGASNQVCRGCKASSVWHSPGIDI